MSGFGQMPMDASAPTSTGSMSRNCQIRRADYVTRVLFRLEHERQDGTDQFAKVDEDFVEEDEGGLAAEEPPWPPFRSCTKLHEEFPCVVAGPLTECARTGAGDLGKRGRNESRQSHSRAPGAQELLDHGRD
jgi:hypothetical protein